LLYINAIVLAVVEGLTEFLPISSTGHMILVMNYFPLSATPDSAFPDAFIVMIQLPAIAAVAVYFWRKLWPFSGDEAHQSKTLSLWFNICAAVIPAVVMGLLFDDLIEHYLFAPIPVAIALVVGGIILILLERLKHQTRFETVHDVPFAVSMGIGLFQCLAMVPGTSRSAATIIGAMILGTSRAAAAEFSFFLAIPTMLGACVYTIAKSGLIFTSEQWALVAIGSVVSFATAYVAVAFLMRYIQRHDFTAFGIYRIVLGGIVLLAYLF